MGRIKNTNIAEGWLVCVSVFYNDLYLSLRMMTNMPVLQNDFVIVGKRMYWIGIEIILSLSFLGDDGESDEPTVGHVVRRADNSFTIWSSGRMNCESLLVHLEVRSYVIMVLITRNIPYNVANEKTWFIICFDESCTAFSRYYSKMV